LFNGNGRAERVRKRKENKQTASEHKPIEEGGDVIIRKDTTARLIDTEGKGQALSPTRNGSNAGKKTPGSALSKRHTSNSQTSGARKGMWDVKERGKMNVPDGTHTKYFKNSPQVSPEIGPWQKENIQIKLLPESNMIAG